MRSEPLDPFSEVVDTNRRWTPDWYGWLKDLSRPPLLGSSTDANLPPAPVAGAGARGLVTDGSNPFNFGTIVSGGGGPNTGPIYSDGIDWRYG